ncbi:HAD family phosphatase [Reichenbachiella sp. MSK19-1]|uniref:HAD family hydrolase n=1 Tax=Reichenbachiella sp. MSK19-1 TaxID=1897631 RepID=UPI000E6D58C0|nr:HAD family phosphatase [Reichenbachiella sp. MSK19-1]RJE75071.1 hypothetical protein BGP76_18335 [Reichenbachiella sp. MSK19-1]
MSKIDFEGIDAVIFDMDGVIIDSEPISRYVVDQMMFDRGYRVEPELHNEFVGRKTSVKWKYFVERFALNDDVETLTKTSDEQYLMYIQEEEMEPLHGLRYLLSHLEKLNKKMIVASSATGHNIRLVLDKFGISNYFQDYVSSDDVKQAKPNPDIFLLAAQKLAVDPHKCLVIEDSNSGILAANAAGMASIGFKNPNSGNQDLHMAVTVVDSLEEIIDLV